MPLGCTNKATLGIKLLLVTVYIGLISELGLFVHFNEHVQWLLFCSNVWTNRPSAPHPHPLLNKSMILVWPEKSI